jgi:hypothetical protein
MSQQPEIDNTTNQLSGRPKYRYTEREIDFTYLMGVFNVSGMEGLSKELLRLKALNKVPHDIVNSLIEAYDNPRT